MKSIIAAIRGALFKLLVGSVDELLVLIDEAEQQLRKASINLHGEALRLRDAADALSAKASKAAAIANRINGRAS